MTTHALSASCQSLENYRATVAIKDNIHLIRLSSYCRDGGMATVAIPRRHYGARSGAHRPRTRTANRLRSGYAHRAMLASCCAAAPRVERATE